MQSVINKKSQVLLDWQHEKDWQDWTEQYMLRSP